jgi:hypothetical protein
VIHALNLRLDLSYRKQASITRDIATMTFSAVAVTPRTSSLSWPITPVAPPHDDF